jgi:hypothetical protein
VSSTISSARRCPAYRGRTNTSQWQLGTSPGVVVKERSRHRARRVRGPAEWVAYHGALFLAELTLYRRGRARDASGAAPGRRRAHRSGGGDDHLSLRLHAHRGHEPLPLRLPRRLGQGVYVLGARSGPAGSTRSAGSAPLSSSSATGSRSTTPCPPSRSWAREGPPARASRPPTASRRRAAVLARGQGPRGAHESRLRADRARAVCRHDRTHAQLVLMPRCGDVSPHVV